jgi:hypothetical protein
MSTATTGFAVTTPEQHSMYRLLSYVAMLSIEINTGLKHSRGSVLAAAKRDGLTRKQTKKGALRDIVAIIKGINPAYEPGTGTKTALGIA